MVGIYKITNKINGKSYIGQSIDILQRWSQHKRSKDFNNPLYLDMEEYGQQNFIYEIIEECLRRELNEKEKFWINYYDSYRNGYNRTCGGAGIRPIIYDQNKVVVKKRKTEGEPFIMLEQKDMWQAVKSLTFSAYKLYLYINQNCDDFEFWLSPKHVQEITGMSKSSFDRAKNELKEKGYLVEKGNTYYSFSNPEDSLISFEELKKKVNKTGRLIDEENEELGKVYRNKIKEILNKYSDPSQEFEKRKSLIELYKEMRKELEKIYENDDSFL